ncbi:hypothetical protein E0H22_20195 [Rhodopseudomonas boonkerdii]|uniref:DUF6285 domain-containing protein n=1 Tax=Rhodopseudomonas boonkerdii TaxID=475937 RepID=UPI001E3E5B7A|nr:DUF6285 domain-containing protein [Rhodopseudomonas boonkerdii]UGV27791.1 hypothetical protein E0H22_20195 [Rhodopseudomonas boonkerdii]
MQDEPRPDELVKAVADFLRNDIAPDISGHAGFKLRVAINALDLVTRQLQDGSENEEHQRLTALLGEGELKALNQLLAARIRSGEIDLATPSVKEHLWQTTLAKLKVDQPNYAAYKRETQK